MLSGGKKPVPPLSSKKTIGRRWVQLFSFLLSEFSTRLKKGLEKIKSIIFVFVCAQKKIGVCTDSIDGVSGTSKVKCSKGCFFFFCVVGFCGHVCVCVFYFLWVYAKTKIRSLHRHHRRLLRHGQRLMLKRYFMCVCVCVFGACACACFFQFVF